MHCILRVTFGETKAESCLKWNKDRVKYDMHSLFEHALNLFLNYYDKDVKYAKLVREVYIIHGIE